MSEDKLDRYNILKYLRKLFKNTDHDLDTLIEISIVASEISIGKSIRKSIDENRIDTIIRNTKNINLSKVSRISRESFNTYLKNLDRIKNTEYRKYDEANLRKYKRILTANIKFLNLKTNQNIIESCFDVEKQLLDLPNQNISYNIDENKNKKIVFFSHATDDKLYTLGLFLYFLLEHDVYLYIYWMNEERIDDGKVLKKSIIDNMSKSECFIFVRTLNSELELSGNEFRYLAIKQWCAWEIGYFHHFNKKQFYINSLDYDSSLINVMLDDFTLLKKISSQIY